MTTQEQKVVFLKYNPLVSAYQDRLIEDFFFTIDEVIDDIFANDFECYSDYSDYSDNSDNERETVEEWKKRKVKKINQIFKKYGYVEYGCDSDITLYEKFIKKTN